MEQKWVQATAGLRIPWYGHGQQETRRPSLQRSNALFCLGIPKTLTRMLLCHSVEPGKVEACIGVSPPGNSQQIRKKESSVSTIPDILLTCGLEASERPEGGLKAEIIIEAETDGSCPAALPPTSSPSPAAPMKFLALSAAAWRPNSQHLKYDLTETDLQRPIPWPSAKPRTQHAAHTAARLL